MFRLTRSAGGTLRRSTLWPIAALASVGLLASACSSSGGGGQAGGGSAKPAASSQTPAGSGAAEAVAAAQKFQVVPTAIGETVPLAKAPPRGIKIAFINCGVVGCSPLNGGFVAAAKALGWTAEVTTYDPSNPGQALQQAINAGYKYIAINAVPLSAITPEVRNAQREGVRLFTLYSTDTPGGASNGLYGVGLNTQGLANLFIAAADWAIGNSHGKARMLLAGLPIFASNAPSIDALKDQAAKWCPSTCSAEELGITPAQLGAGQAVDAIVAYVQTHRYINYVMLANDTMGDGLLKALRSVGLNDVQVVGEEATAVDLKSLMSGQSSFWTMIPDPYISWVVVDWMARLASGEKTLSPAELASGSSLFVAVTSSSEAAKFLPSGYWDGPANYQEQFEKLWHVSG